MFIGYKLYKHWMFIYIMNNDNISRVMGVRTGQAITNAECGTSTALIRAANQMVLKGGLK